MAADASAAARHERFAVDAQEMTALLFDFATRADYRVAVRRKFDGIKALFGEYQGALKKTYVVPRVLRRRGSQSPVDCAEGRGYSTSCAQVFRRHAETP